MIYWESKVQHRMVDLDAMTKEELIREIKAERMDFYALAQGMRITDPRQFGIQQEKPRPETGQDLA